VIDLKREVKWKSLHEKPDENQVCFIKKEDGSVFWAYFNGEEFYLMDKTDCRINGVVQWAPSLIMDVPPYDDPEWDFSLLDKDSSEEPPLA